MNVIVSNKQKSIIDNANIDAIKDLNGLFNIDDLISKFKNYFFSKMILDATSIIDFASEDVLSKLANGIGGERLFILLPSSPEPPESFIENLNSLRIYNYSTDINELVSLIDNPRTGANNSVGSSLNDNFSTDNGIKDDGFNNSNDFQNVDSYQNISNDFYSNMNINNDMIVPSNNGMQQNFDNQNVLNNNSYQNQNMNVPNYANMNNMPINNMANANSDIPQVPQGFNNQNAFNNGNYQNYNIPGNIPMNNMALNNNIPTNNYNGNANMSVNNSIPTNNYNGNTNMYQMPNMFNTQGINNGNINKEPTNNMSNIYAASVKSNKTIIGFKNVTSNAGSTSLIYMLTKILVNTYGKKAVGLEINKNDFRFYQEKFFMNSSERELVDRLRNSNADIVLVDLNDCQDTSFCTDVIYLVEPSVIKLNMVMMTSPFTFKGLKGRKIVLNKSLLSHSDVNAFASEAGTPIFYNIPPLNDRVNNSVLDKFLGFLKLI